MILILTGGEVFTPAPAGAATVLALNGAIARVGSVDTKAVETLGVPIEVLEAHDCVVVPGLIDPHVHLTGGSGEEGYETASPEIFLEELVLVLRRETLELVHVVAKGQVVMRNGVVTQQDRFLQKSARRIRLDGEQA